MAEKRRGRGKGGGEHTEAGASNVKLTEELWIETRDRLDELHNDMAVYNAAKRTDIKTVYGDLENQTGISTKLIRLKYSEHRDRLKQEKRRANLEKSEADKLAEIDATMGELFGHAVSRGGQA